MATVDRLQAQCCAGGSGSPIAGGASQGVLLPNQAEINLNSQFIRTNQFFKGDKPDTALYFDRFTSDYQYLRLAYGLSDRLTFSVEGGFFASKKERGRNGDPNNSYQSTGLGDLILFPRYQVLRICGNAHTSELTLGIGLKIPVGHYNDSTEHVLPYNNIRYTVRDPLSVQLSSGANDFIFYGFWATNFHKRSFRLFANSLYIRKGWNPMGEKIGDYASLGLFASKTFWNNLGVTLQLKGEWVGRMDMNADVLMSSYTFDHEATGYRKVFLTPQVSYSKGPVTIFALSEFPIYQYVNKVQIGSQHSFTLGLSYRFLIANQSAPTAGSGWHCPMHPEVTSGTPAKCTKCGMALVKTR